MARRLPPLNGLKAFEAAARSESFTRAAEELNVTQGAVSHQVKALEETLGLKLFHRERQRLVLTEAGREYLAVVRDALDRIAVGTERLLQRQRAAFSPSARRRILPPNGWSTGSAGLPRNIPASICGSRQRRNMSISLARMSMSRSGMVTAIGPGLMWSGSIRSGFSRFAVPKLVAGRNRITKAGGPVEIPAAAS